MTINIYIKGKLIHSYYSVHYPKIGEIIKYEDKEFVVRKVINYIEKRTLYDSLEFTGIACYAE